MVIRAVGVADHNPVEAFLLGHVEGAMFPLANLRQHGLADGDFASDHPHAMRMWWVGAGVVGVTRAGMVMPMLPEGVVPGLAAAMAGVDVTGAVGPAGQVRAVLRELGLADCRAVLDNDEPGFVLDLCDLRLPALPGAVLVPLQDGHLAMMLAWRAAYRAEVLGATATEAVVRAEADMAMYLAADSHRVLWVNRVCVALTGFNAILPEIVQIGGVYVPPALRNRGHARMAVALHLMQARSAGVKRAVLFAANAAAVRAYEAIGFRPANPVTLVLFDGVHRVGG